jgi:hypothetical protein
MLIHIQCCLNIFVWPAYAINPYTIEVYASRMTSLYTLMATENAR